MRSARLEEAFAVRHDLAIAVSSGTAALEIILRAIGVEAVIIVPALLRDRRRRRSPAHLRLSTATRTMAIDPAVSRGASPDTAAVVIVHIGGLITPGIDEIAQLCAARGVQLVEDAAHAHGSAFDGRSAGQFGAAASFSFYPTKVMAGGEGGMIVTDDDNIAEEARVYRDQGKGSFHANFHTRMGANWRMGKPHAADRLSQLPPRRVHRAPSGAGRATTRRVARPRPARSDPRVASSTYKVAFLPKASTARLPSSTCAPIRHRAVGRVYDTPLHHQPCSRSSTIARCRASGCARARVPPAVPALSEHDLDYVVSHRAALEHEVAGGAHWAIAAS